jgi:uncharacterized membrane protein
MDLAAGVAIGCGIAMAVVAVPERPSHPVTSLFAAPHAGWFHIKLAIVVLGILPVHGMIRAKIKKFSNGQISPIPQWLWSLLLAAIAAVVIMVFKGPYMFGA